MVEARERERPLRATYLQPLTPPPIDPEMEAEMSRDYHWALMVGALSGQETLFPVQVGKLRPHQAHRSRG